MRIKTPTNEVSKPQDYILLHQGNTWT